MEFLAAEDFKGLKRHLAAEKDAPAVKNSRALWALGKSNHLHFWFMDSILVLSKHPELEQLQLQAGLQIQVDG